jgi:hypothetical protein
MFTQASLASGQRAPTEGSNPVCGEYDELKIINSSIRLYTATNGDYEYSCLNIRRKRGSKQVPYLMYLSWQ